MRYLIFFITVLIFTACSTNNSQNIKKNSNLKSIKEIDFIKESGTLTVQVDEITNEWVSLKVTASAAVIENSHDAIEKAYEIAKLRAKGSIVEFINNKVTVKSNYETLTKLNEDVNNENLLIDDFEDVNKNITLSSNNKKSNKIDAFSNLHQKISSEAKGRLSSVAIIKKDLADDARLVSITLELKRENLLIAEQLNERFSL